MKVVGLNEVNPHNIAAIVQQGEDVEVRYLDRKESVLVTNSNTTQVMVQILKKERSADSDG